MSVGMIKECRYEMERFINVIVLDLRTAFDGLIGICHDLTKLPNEPTCADV